MPLLVILAFPFVEIFFALWVADEVGFWNMFSYLLLGAVVGVGLLSLTGRSFLIETQRQIAMGQDPGAALLAQALRFFSALLFLFPGFLSDALAVLLLLISLFSRLFSPQFSRGVHNWNSRFVVFTHHTGGPRGPVNTRDVTPDDPKVIDISPGNRSGED